jgi:hypothetical protein
MRRLLTLLGFAALGVLALAQTVVGVRAMGENETDIGMARLGAVKSGDRVQGEFEANILVNGERVHVRGVVVELRIEAGDSVRAHFAARALANGRPVMVRGTVLDGGRPENDGMGFEISTPSGSVFDSRTTRQSVSIRRLNS